MFHFIKDLRRYLGPIAKGSRLLLLLLLCPPASAQTSKKELWADIDRLGSNYYSYHGEQYPQTPAPEGYEAFYISHFGRHGSRYLTSNSYYHRAIGLLERADSANALTRKGRRLLKDLRIAYADAKGRSGELTPLGGREHEGIAARASERYPGVFAPGAKVTARATSSHRCQVSMSHFIGKLKEMNPHLEVEAAYRPEDKWYMSNSSDSVAPTPGSDQIRQRAAFVRDSLRRTVDLSPLFLKDPSLIRDYNGGNPAKFSEDLYDIAEDMQCRPELGMKRTFRKYFTREQLYTIFLSNSISWLISPGYYEGMTPGYKRGYLPLKHMLDQAEAAIADGSHGAFLRFSHDGYVILLLRALELDGCRQVPADFLNVCDHFSLYDAIPMASNFQMIFFRKAGSDDILVKFLLQEQEKHIPIETDMWPFYHWKDVLAYYRPRINSFLETRK